MRIKLKIIIIILPAILLFSCKSITIVDATYENRPHFKIKTKTANYFYDKAGGGLSRVIDPDGTDWVHYKGDPHAPAPSGASGGFRGIPNLVYRSDDGGAGHPGFEQCISEQVDDRTIRSRSKSGKWQWTWTFYDDYAQLVMEKTDPGHAYWFLYEGPVAGSFNPSEKYWGTDLGGPRYEVPSLNQGESIMGNWQWAYFGDQKTNRILFVAQKQKDPLIDHFAYMGDTKEGKNASNGMVVFGFGREKRAKPLMAEPGISFKIGFINKKIASEKDHEWVTKQINEKIAK